MSSTSPSPSLLLPLPSSPATSSPSNPAPTTTPPPPPPPPTTVAPTTTNSPTSAPATSSPTTAPTSLTTAATSSTSSTTSSTTSASQIVPTSSGQAVTTVTSFVGASTTPTSSTPQTHSTSNSFFSNKGAVAGVFAVVGLIVVALVIALIVNAIRRRRAQKFDRDVAEAAAEAAMSSRSPFDDYSYGNNGSGGYGYSENNQGTYQQPPLPSHGNFGMSEMSRYDPYAAAPPTLAAAASRASNRNETASGPGGLAGVGAGNLAREPSKHAPYHAFAGPVPQPHELRSNTMRSRRGEVLEAAGLADTGAATMASNNYNNDAFLARKPSEYTQNTHNSGRSQGHGSMGNHPAMLQPGYPVDSYYPQRNDTRSPESFVGYQPAQSALPNPHDATLHSPSLPGHQSDHTFGDDEEYHDTGSPTALRSDEQRMSYQDDHSQGNRVLRVANE